MLEHPPYAHTFLARCELGILRFSESNHGGRTEAARQYDISCSECNVNIKMAAIVRVKRRRDEDPANSIILKCKKAKQSFSEEQSSSEESNAVDSVFKFAGTLPERVRKITFPLLSPTN